MVDPRKLIERTGWIISVLSVVSLVMASGLLAASLVAFEWQLSLFEATTMVLATISLVGLACGIGLIKRKRLARTFAVILLWVGVVFWGLSSLNMALAAIEAPQEVWADVLQAPIVAAMTILLAAGMLAWCIYSIHALGRAAVKDAFDA